MKVDCVWEDARLATMVAAADPLGLVLNGLVAAKAGRIVYAGSKKSAPAFEADRRIRLEGRWVTPGLIDCHTHLVHGGNRAKEFELRLAGASYEEIARAGGGIMSTVAATRAASVEDLVASALPRLDALLAEGVTTVEVKSGYGLDEETEVRQLVAARELGGRRPVHVAPTYLGAHAIPPEFADDRERYLDFLCRRMIPRIASERLAEAVDVFCERIAFNGVESIRILQCASNYGLRRRVHADQLSNMHAAKIAAFCNADSADHLEHTDEEGVAAMAKTGTVAVLLPGAYYTLRERQAPPIEAFRRHGVAMAVATDMNPGSSPMTSLLLAMNMAATLFRMTVAECLAGVARSAAAALGRQDSIGALEPGLWCDLAVWDVEDLAELVYRIGFNPLHSRVYRGVPA